MKNIKSLGILLLSLVLLYISVIFITSNVFNSYKIDVTEEKLFTISESTKKLLRKLDQNINLKLYYSKEFSKKSPQIKTYFQRVKKLLKKYENISNKKVNIDILYPQSYSQLEDEALELGLQSLRGPNNTQLYFGLVGTNSIDGKEVIKFLNPSKEEFLEYDLTMLIYKLINTKEEKVALIDKDTKNHDSIIKRLQELYKITFIEEDIESIDANQYSTLIVIRPETLSEKYLFLAEQYVLSGGNALFFLDQSYTNEKNNVKPLISNKIVKDMLNNWGANYGINKVVLDSENAMRLSVQNNSYSNRTQTTYHPGWIELKGKSIDNNNIISSNLKMLRFINPALLSKNENKKETKFTTIISTSNKARNEYSYMVKDVQSINDLKILYKEGDETHPLVVHLSSSAKSIFTNGIEDNKTKNIIKPKIMESKDLINVVLVADSDILDDRFWVRKRNFFGQEVLSTTSDNADLILNIVENLGGNDDFIGLRGLGKSKRPFLYLQEIKKAATVKYFEKEKELKNKLLTMQNNLNEKSKKLENSVALNITQRKIVQKAREETVKVRKQLRAVQHNLNKDIESAKNVFKWINILFIPSLVILFGILFVMKKSNRYKKD